MTPDRQFKQCRRCNLVKTALRFHIRCENADGLASDCIDCTHAIQAERRAAKLAHQTPDQRHAAAVAEALRGWAAPNVSTRCWIAYAPSCEVWAL